MSCGWLLTNGKRGRKKESQPEIKQYPQETSTTGGTHISLAIDAGRLRDTSRLSFLHNSLSASGSNLSY